MHQPPRRLWFWLAPFISAAAGGAGIWISTNFFVHYGWFLMIYLPMLMGFLSSALLRLDGPRTYLTCFGNAILAILGLSMALLGFVFEGIICLVMALPLILLPVMLGVAVGYYLFHARNLPGGFAAILLFAIVLVLSAFDFGAKGSISEAKTSIEVAGTPEEVWEAVVGLKDLPEPRDWVLRTGLACPVSTQIEGSGVGAARLCLLSTGPMPERITVWEPGHRLGFVALSTPPPLQELNPFGEAHPPHLNGHYKVLYGEFQIDDNRNGRCRLTRLTRYENRIRPAFYWDLWCDFAADRAHRHVLEAVRDAVRLKRSIRVTLR